MSVLYDPVELSNRPTISRKVARRKEDDVLVFGYACKMFEDDQKASFFNQGKHLIPWMGDESLLIDRYDARLHFTDVHQFLPKQNEQAASLTAQEEELERLCDEERYLDLNQDVAEYDLQQEEEMKRFQQALAEDGAYNAVSFSYTSCADDGFIYPQNVTDYRLQKSGSVIPQTHIGGPPTFQDSPVPVHRPFQQPEPFVPPKELDIPPGMEIPDTAKKQAIIERTAVFVCKQGKQMEILVKAKQSGNPQFDFLLMDNWLNPYYKHVLKYITEGKYCPEIPKQEEEQEQPKEDATADEEQQSDANEGDSDESDGEYELHPLLQASLHKKIQRPSPRPSSGSSSPLPETLGGKFSRTFAPVTNQSSAAVLTDSDNGSDVQFSEMDRASSTVDYSTWYSQGDVYGHYMSSAGYLYHHGAPILSVADMIPPPPPPPGEGPLEEEWIDSPSSLPPLPPPPPPPVPPKMFIPHETSVMGVISPQPIPPPPDLQPIVDKLATYVAKNGPDFEAIIKAKNDARFDFLNPWNAHYGYYELKKKQASENLQKQRAEEATTANGQNTSEVSKGPISFSIRNKDRNKPKIEYRTSVIYKQSCEQGESDEDEEKDEENKTTDVSGKEPDNKKDQEYSTGSQQREKPEQETGDLQQQLESIEAAERIAQHLESESRDKQLQLERRRKASLFISMLKKTNPGEDSETNQSAESFTPTGKHRTFSETRQSRSESPAPLKKARLDDGSPGLGGVGVPSPDSIKVTQDLTAKVLAASRNR